MPNIMISHLDASNGDFVAVIPPCPCFRFFIQGNDPTVGFVFRANNEEADTELTVPPGYALPVEPGWSMNAEDIVGYVKGGEVVVCVGLSAPMPVA